MATRDTYALSRDSVETERLNTQNQSLIKAVGYTLHPAIRERLPKDIKVSELATGTAAFLVSLSKELSPTSQFDGSDYSPDQFPSKDELPTNISLSVADAKRPAPEESRGKYDVVCIRFINAAMQPEDWKRVAEHAIQLLKPGGALQWIEGDFLQTMTVLRESPCATTSAMTKWSNLSLSPFVQFKWFIENLLSVLEDVGFTGIRQDITSSDRLQELRKVSSLIYIGAWCSLLRLQAKLGLPGALADEEVIKAQEEMRKEVETGAYTRMDLHQFIAFKGR